MAEPPRRRSIQFAPPHPDGGDPSPSPTRGRTAYAQYPTPHPRKLSDASSYFDGVHNHAPSGIPGTQRPRGASQPPPRTAVRGDAPSRTSKAAPGAPDPNAHPQRSGLLRRSSTMDSEIREQHAEARANRARLPRRSSSVDSGSTAAGGGGLGRTFSALEEGEGGRRGSRRRGSTGGGVVGALLRFGMEHGLPGTGGGGGLHVPRVSVHVPGEFRVTKTSTLYERDDGSEGRSLGQGSVASASLSYRDRAKMLRERRRSAIVHHVEDYVSRQKFLLRLAKALLSFGAPSHRIESQLHSAGEILDVHVAFVHLPNLIMVTFMDTDTRTSETHFVRAGGRVALTSLHKVHLVYRDVLHDKIGATGGCEQLKRILQARPLYNIWTRCLLAFFCASIICVLSFGGSIVDMFVSGLSASVLQYLGLNAASKSSIYANVYEISVSIVVSFIARLLGTLPGNLFCYSAISSAGVVLILPGFTILIAALELTSRNILCGSVRMVYAIIYTLFLGFGLTIGSDFYLLVNPKARRNMAATAMLDSETLHGYILNSNTSVPLSQLGGTFTFMQTADSGASHIIKGCYRNPAWPWWRQPFPWWTMLFLVPIYSTFSSIANLQAIRSIQLPIMVAFSCAAYAANKGANYLISDRSDIVSAFGAFVIGLCGNIYSRLVGGTAFTSMVTGVLFLVPSAIGNGGGLIQNYSSAEQQYSSSFGLGIRMIQVSIGVTIGLFVSQIMVYALGRRKNAAHFAF
ncbi:DUF1212-domain-containing protein [Trametes coccinea BRFM310]|uniref:DUF1212-domain-containing protein n=1 Tax=Trametes coccinea (strain BRFM310) TaxID=1353009 RepID=A0A1Y2IRP3_TRAC3|nr:DUF1212-domain-containing protein [Trametes coccinea BRFM310]